MTSYRNTSHRDLSRSRLFLGLALIVIGSVYSFDRLGWVEAAELWNWAPLILVVAGVMKLTSPTGRVGRLGGTVLIGVGVFLLAGNLGWTDLGLFNLLPLIPLLVGLRLLLGPPRVQAVESFHTLGTFVTMGGLARGNNSAHFRGGDLVAVMGGVDLDLRQARITEGPAVIDAFAFWGGIDIKVPEEWTVRVEGVPLLGAFEDSTHRPVEREEAVVLDDEPPVAIPKVPSQELVVKRFADMGGVGVGN